MGLKISKKKLWIIIACLAAVLIAAAAVTVFLLTRSDAEETVTTPENVKIYWNIDRQLYFGQGENGVSSRTADRTDGYYHILFSVDGRPTERKAKSLSLVNKIDDNDAMGLVIDENTREITDIIPIDEISGGYLCRRAFVKEVNGTEITVNSSSTMIGEETTFKVKTTTPIVDVSLQALSDAGLTVKLETLEPKDQITVINDKDGGIYGVYITKRGKLTPIYWNIERQYDSKFMETKRKPDADGVYHILMAVGGEQVTVKCKDKKLVDEIDARGSRSCGLEFDEEGFVTASISAARCTGGGSVASWYDIMSLDGYEFVAEKHSQTAKDNGRRITATLDPDCEIYNVSTKYEDHIGERTEVRVSDRVQGFSDATGKVVYLFIVQRWEQGEFYWNAYRMWDSTAGKSTRTRSADGYFHFVMCHNGQVEDIKVADEGIANDMDKAASRSMGLVVQNGVVVRFITPGNMYASQGSWYDVEEFVDAQTIHVKKNSVTASDYGREYNISLADDCKVYNVTETYSDHIGESATLKLGDRIQAWVDYTGKAKYVYIVGRTMTNPVTAHAVSHVCEECGNSVNWTPWTSGSSLPVTEGHYYLCGDVVAPQASIKANQNVVLCLNGHKIRASGKRIYATFEKGSSLSIHDCVGTGKMYSTYAGDIGTTQGAIIWGRYGTVNLYGGTYVAPTGASQANGPVIATNSNVKVTIKNSTIIGGTTSKSGAAIYMAGGSGTTLTMENTTVTGGNAGSGQGDAVYMSAKSKLFLSGKVEITAGSHNGLYLASGSYITFNAPLAAGSNIAVTSATSNGKISTNYNTGDEKHFTSNKSGYTVKPSGSALYLQKEIKPLDPDPNHVHCVCGAASSAGLTNHTCATNVKWIGVASADELPAAMAGDGDDYYIYLKNDITATGTIAAPAGKNLHICLNGHTVKMVDGKASRLFNTSAQGSTLSMCDCAGGGKAVGNGTDYADQGAFLLLQNNVNCRFDLYGGTIEGFSSKTYGGAIATANGTVNIWGGAIRNNRAVTSGGNITAIRETVVNIYGGTVEGGVLTGETSRGGNIAVTSKNATLNITGGIIRGGLVNAYAKAGTTELNNVDGYTDINAVSGGNIYNAGTMNVGSVTIKDGKASSKGGNICNEGTLNLNGATVQYGQVFNTSGQNGGGNIYNDGTANITAGTYKYGYYITKTQANCNQVRANIFSSSANTKYYISGGNIGGRFSIPRGEIHLSGNPVIHMGSSGLVITEPATTDGYDVKLYLEGALQEGADVYFYYRLPDGSVEAPGAGNYVLVADKSGTATNEDAENSAKYFGTSIAGVEFKAYNGAVYAVPTGGDIDPEAANKHNHAVYGAYTAAASHGVSTTKYIYTAVATEAELTSAIANAQPNTPAYIYLDADIKLTAATNGSNSSNYFINMNKANGSENKKIFLCLNGHTLTTHDTTDDLSVKLMQINASGCEVTICDCAANRGALIGGRKNLSMDNAGGLFYVASGGKLHLYGVDLKDGSAKTGGAIDVMTATVDMFGCNVTGGESTTGLIYLGNKNSVLNMYDCTVKGATSGYGLYLNTGAKSPVLSGTVVIKDNADGNVYLPTGTKLTLKELSGAAYISVTGTEDEIFATSDKDYSEICDILTDDETLSVEYSDGNYTLVSALIDDGKHRHAIYGASASAKSHGVDSVKHEYTAVKSEAELTAAISAAAANTPAYIYLDADITLTEATTGTTSTNYFINIHKTTNGENKKIFLCLNGHTLTTHNSTADVSVKLFQLNAKGLEFTVCDCDKNRGGALAGGRENLTVSNTGGLFYVASGSSLSLYNVRLINGSAKTGGAIDLVTGTLNVYDCEFTGGTSTTGLLYITNSNSTANIYDTSFTGATAGHGIYLNTGAKAPVLSGKIVVKDNAAGNIFLSVGTTVTFNELSADSEIYVDPEEQTAVFANSDKDYTGICTIASDIAGKSPAYAEGKYSLVAAKAKMAHISFDVVAAAKSKLTILSSALNLFREVGLYK